MCIAAHTEDILYKYCAAGVVLGGGGVLLKGGVLERGIVGEGWVKGRVNHKAK